MQQFIDSYDFTGKKAIVRVDFNVPLDENFHITDDTRIRRAMPTLKKILEKGGAVIIMSHLGRPKKVDPKCYLSHIVDHVSECLGVPPEPHRGPRVRVPGRSRPVRSRLPEGR